MRRDIVIDEFQITVLAPRGLPDAEYLAMRRALDRRAFQRELHGGIRAVFRRHRALLKTTVKLSR